MPLPPLLVFAVLLAVVWGLPFGLYALLTRRRRRALRQIHEAASERGWQFRRRWILRGNPTEFDIRGQTPGGLPWILSSRSTGGHDRGWSVRLGMRFASLGGEVDLAVLPRDPQSRGPALVIHALPSGALARVAAFSGTAASAVAFLQDASEVTSGLPDFDAAYRILAVPQRIAPPLLDAALANQILRWPADTIAPHSVLAWRDPFAFHLQARLPATPNWATVSYFVALAEAFVLQLPPPTISRAPRRLVDRLIARFLS